MLIGTALLSAPAVAEFELQQLVQFHTERQTMDGYVYATKHLKEMEGDPEFDYYYAMLSIDSGNSGQGVFALERVLALQPNNRAARLELARGYFALEEYDRARHEFKQVLKSRPPSQVKAKIERYMDAIRLKSGRYRTTSQGFIELGAGYDSNLNAAPSDERISLGALDVRLNANSVKREDGYAVLSGLYRFNRPLTQGRSFFVSGALDYRGYAKEQTFDNGTVQLNGGMVFIEKQDRYQWSGQLSQYLLDGEAFRNTAALNGQWRRRLDQQRQLSSFAQLSKLDYPVDSVRNSSGVLWGLGLTENFVSALSPVLFVNGYLGLEKPDESTLEAQATAERDYFGLKAGAQFTLTPKSTLSSSLSYQRSQFGAHLDLTDDKKNREDDYINVSADWAWLFAKEWSLRGRASYLVNDSNSALGRYDRLYGDLRLRYEIN
ncbi:MAG: tetratricopeptide repeat protein [Gammaproteobacteria bacterium]|nr:tetratricopeptide repeat protein [Gammaproteobacteria bacterium]